jgi:helicase
MIKLTPPQEDIIDFDLLNSGFNCVIQMPTGSGKTWLAEDAIH